MTDKKKVAERGWHPEEAQGPEKEVEEHDRGLAVVRGVKGAEET